MAYTSTIQILKVGVELSKKLNPDTGKPYESHIARTALINDDGELETVGRLRVPRELVDVAKVGTYRASFALRVPDYGPNKGDVVSELTGLVPVPVRPTASAPCQRTKGRVMSVEDVQSLARGVAMLALVCGVLGALCFEVLRGVCHVLGDYFERRADKAWRIREARWRAHWNIALREAHQSGYEGRRAIAYAANTMRTRKAAIAELEAL